MKAFSLTVVAAAALWLASLAAAQDSPAAAGQKPPTQQELFDQFKKTIDGATLVGNFTMGDEKEPKLRREEYTILSVQKLEEEDYWLFKARIKYGDKDGVFPMPLQVKWAGTTPVITLDNVTILNLGTFDARVLIHDNQYVGTWRHGDKGGQLFGVIEHRDAADEKAADVKPSGATK
jgi:hypothetical protein